MKKLFLIFLFTSISFAQSNMLLLMDGGVSYKNTETKLYLASLTTPISPTYAATLDSFITKVKDSLSITSLSQKFDVMYDLGGYSQEQSLKNLVKRSSDATAVNSPTWTQWQGFTGANTKYINTNYNSNADGGIAKLNNVSLGYYDRANITTGLAIDGSIAGGYAYVGYLNGQYIIRLHSSNSPGAFGSGASTLGFTIGTRTASDSVAFYKNGVLVSKIASTSTSIPDSNVDHAFLATNNSNSTFYYHLGQESFAFIGIGLTATEVSKFTNCVEWLQDRKNSGVIP